MNEQRIREMVAILDTEVPREGAVVQLDQYGGGPDEGQVIANQSGYFRLGIEFLKAGIAEQEGDSNSVKVDLEYLVTPGSSIKFDWFERRDSMTNPSVDGQFEIVPMLAMGCVVVCLGLILIGAATVIGWLAQQLNIV